MSTRQELLTGSISGSFIHRNACRFAAAIHRKRNALDNCIGFIDGTVIAVARPGDAETQNIAYNGHKRKHALK